MHAEKTFRSSPGPVSGKPRSILHLGSSTVPRQPSTFNLQLSTDSIDPPKSKFKKQFETIPRPRTYPPFHRNTPAYTAPCPPTGRIECYLF